MPTAPRVRRSLFALTPAEQADLRTAFLGLYETGAYQSFAGILEAYGHTQQNDLLFLPWARAFFDAFEQLLRTQVATVTLPYWDYTSAEALAEGLPAFVADPMVEAAPNPLFRARWSKPLHTFRETQAPARLAAAKALAEEAAGAEDFVTFSTQVWKADIASHLWIGGSARDTATTAFDPLFWFSHCNLDRQWDRWQRAHDQYRAPPSVEAAALDPFTHVIDGAEVPLTGADVLRTAVDLGYVYA